MTFIEWLFSSFDNPRVEKQWGIFHIAIFLLAITAIIVISLFKNKSQFFRKNIITVLAFLILAFEIMRRVVNFARPTIYGGEIGGWKDYLYIIIPRPWCAISCWLLIASVFVNKKFLYNYGAMSALICAIIFFAYPDAGFNNQFMEFENIYSIVTHALLLVTSISLMTLKMTDFHVKRGDKPLDGALAEIIALALTYVYAFIEIALGVESDPLYFMPGNGVNDVLGLPYGLYLLFYILFLAFYFSLPYIIQYYLDHKKPKARKRTVKSGPVSAYDQSYRLNKKKR